MLTIHYHSMTLQSVESEQPTTNANVALGHYWACEFCRNGRWDKLENFPAFSKPPQELQNLIWQAAIDDVDGRIVEITDGPFKQGRGGQWRPFWETEFTSSC